MSSYSLQACRKCHQNFTPCALDQPFCTACGPVDIAGNTVDIGSPVRIARWQTASSDNGAEMRTGKVYKVEQQFDGRWVIYMTFPPAPWKRPHSCAFSYDMVLAYDYKPGQQIALFSHV